MQGLSQLPHETLTHILIGGGFGAIGLLLFVAFVLWRVRRRGGPPKQPVRRRKSGGGKRRR